MTEDLASSLASYKVQLTQVDAALTTDPENDELMKLKQDLLEVGFWLVLLLVFVLEGIPINFSV